MYFILSTLKTVVNEGPQEFENLSAASELFVLVIFELNRFGASTFKSISELVCTHYSVVTEQH